MGAWITETEPSYRKKGTLSRNCTDSGCFYSEQLSIKASKGLSYTEEDGKLLVSGLGSFKGEFLYISDQTPDGRAVSGIASKAFTDQSQLRYAVLSENTCHLEAYAFAGCENLVSITLPAHCTLFDAGMFLSCPSLTAVHLPQNLEILPENTFDGCQALETIKLPETLKELGYGAFNLCSSLKNIILPETLETISAECFDGCSSLQSISLPADVRSIGSYAFAGCTSLVEFKILSPLEKLQEFAFSGCTALQKVFLSKEIRTISAPNGTSPFFECSKNLKLVTDAKEKPEGWSEYFNVYYPGDPFDGSDDPIDFKRLEVIYGAESNF